MDETQYEYVSPPILANRGLASSESCHTSMRSKWSLRSALPIYAAQAASAFLPLVLAPLIVRHTGVASFGEYATLWLASQIASLVSEYSFDAVGPRLLSETAPSGVEAQHGIYASVLTAKMLLLLISVPLGYAIAAITLGRHLTLGETTGIACLVFGIAAQANWYHISLGRPLVVAYLTITSKAVTAAGSLYLVYVTGGGSPEAHFLALALPWFIAGLTVSVSQDYRGLRAGIMIQEAFAHLQRGGAAFAGNSAAAIQNVLGASLIGMFDGAASLGTFSAIDRIARSASACLKPIFQTLYPFMTRLHIEQPEIAQSKILTLVRATCLAGMLILALSFTWADAFLTILYGSQMSGHGLLLTMLVGWLIVGTVNNLLGIQGLLASGRDVEYSRGSWAALIIYVCASVLSRDQPRYPYWIAGAAILSELCATAMFLHSTFRRHGKT